MSCLPSTGSAHSLVEPMAARLPTRQVLIYVRAVVKRRGSDASTACLPARPGTPQGGVGDFAGAGEPVHALRVRYVDGPGVQPGCPFERYADDGVVHCRAGGRPSACWPGSPRGWRRWACGFTPTRRGSCTARTATSRRPRAHLVHVPRLHVPASGGARQERPARSRRSCPRSAPRRSRLKATGSAAADPPAHRLTLERPGGG